jgi:hypothetical protein
MEHYTSIIGYRQPLFGRWVGNRVTEKRLAGRGDRKPVCLVDARPVSIGLCVRRAQVDLSGCDVGVPKFLPQGFDVDTVRMPPRGVQHAKGMAGFLGFLNLVTSIVCLVDETVDDSISVNALALMAVALTGVLTTVSVLLFGARRSKREGS